MIALFEAHRAGLFKQGSLWNNVVAGVVVGIVALPLAMAFAIASGAKPEQGLYTAIALLTLVAVVADGMTGTRHKSNQELIGQGAANILAPLFGGFAATGAIAPTSARSRHASRARARKARASYLSQSFLPLSWPATE